MNDLSRQDKMTKVLVSMDFMPALIGEDTKLNEYTQLPISRLNSLGVGFNSLAQVIESFSGNGTGIYHVTVPKGTHLASFNNGAGNLGSVLSNTTNQVSGQAVLNPISFDPTMMFMAAALANIDKKLDSIQETQKEMFDYLKQKEKSETRGNLNYLSDISKNYKYNWNNELYKNSNHIKVLDIKQSAEQKIDFYRGLITDRVRKRNWLHVDNDVKKQIDGLQDLFKDYQLSLYMFAYSAFLEVMLLENYEEAYLSSVSGKIEDYSFRFRELYTECFNQIEDYSSKSVQSTVLNGLSKVSTASGKFIEKVPVISKSQIDEGLIGTGEKLASLGDRHLEKMMKRFINKEQECVRPFVESIEVVNRLYNNDLEIAFDGKALYVKTA